MRKLKDALRLKLEGGRSHQQIATSLGISKGVVTKYVGLAVAAGLDWPAVQALDEAALERRLLAASQPATSYARPDYGRIHQELRRKGVTLMLLWEEHCAQVSDEHDPAPRSSPGATRSSARTTANSPSGSSARCARSTAPAKSCSSTMLAPPSR